MEEFNNANPLFTDLLILLVDLNYISLNCAKNGFKSWSFKILTFGLYDISSRNNKKSRAKAQNLKYEQCII